MPTSGEEQVGVGEEEEPGECRQRQGRRVLQQLVDQRQVGGAVASKQVALLLDSLRRQKRRLLVWLGDRRR
jgi:hypothetical protein